MNPNIHQSPNPEDDEIDVVITWVDGSHQQHRLQREKYIDGSQTFLSENGTNPHRWACNDEIFYCLTSIGRFAPWVRKIWIVTNGQRPNLDHLNAKIKSKTQIIDHKIIFPKNKKYLPTFNSVSIETLLWKIPGLSEKFLYFNDDVFLTKPTRPSDFFVGDKVLLRGRFQDFTSLSLSSKKQNAPENFNLLMHLNAAILQNIPAHRVFKSAHVVHPFLKTHMQYLSNRFPNEFTQNITPKFRDNSQFSPQGLHNQSLLIGGNACIHQDNDHLHVYSRIALEDLLLMGFGQKNFHKNSIKMICINDLPEVIKIYPDILSFLDYCIFESVTEL